ncbi:hypothetical protein JX265_009729 [Neoarthrinium moseri]|uniref:Heterokaryon incompatibility domain-containing protein n=1 Tax=Neoarthrinium moseri TaxID=1658444 RepID=A0A9Q0ALD0_9PEZI|nr:hypothetical protein JX265_009729 [Neoarthrinium moseri]
MMHLLYDMLPVAEDEFRLLRLFPATNLEDPISIGLFTQGILDCSLSYDAISYHWGDPQNRHSIIANGLNLSVTDSLLTALRYLRDTATDKILWVDGICINQQNISERNHQVMNMGKIFSNASCVRIWLGEAEDGVQDAIKIVSNLEMCLNKDQEIVKAILTNKAASNGITGLLQRPYWKRMWVFQEIVLSKRAVVHCGIFQASWPCFRALDKVSGDQRLWAQIQVKEPWVLELRRALFGIAQFCMDRDDGERIDNVLHPTRSLKATDPRDKLYALLGVCKLPRDFNFAADYSQPLVQVYTNFAESLIRMDHDLSILLTAGIWDPRNGPEVGLPSWVPDFRGIQGVDIRYLAASYRSHFNATKGKSPYYSFKVDETSQQNHLQLEGIIFDSVNKFVVIDGGTGSRQKASRLVDPRLPGPYRVQVSQTFQSQSIFRTMIFDDPTLSPEQVPERIDRLALGFAYDLVQEHLQIEDISMDSKAQVDAFLSSFRTANVNEGMETLCQTFWRLLEEDQEELYWFREEFLIRIQQAPRDRTIVKQAILWLWFSDAGYQSFYDLGVHSIN